MNRPRVFVGLGSNLASPQQQVTDAIHALDALADVELRQTSSLYRTAAWGVTDQPAFVNAVAEVATDWSPGRLLDALLAIEAAAGRVRKDHWGPREIDLDILAFGQCVFHTQRLRLPHPGIAERAFVLEPWAEIAPDVDIPGLGRVREVLDRCPGRGDVRRIQH